MSTSEFRCLSCKVVLALKHHGGYLDAADGVHVRLYNDRAVLRCACGAIRIVDLDRLTKKAA